MASGMNGTDLLLLVNTGTEAVPAWTVVAGQRDASLSESNETIDFSSKDNRAWEGAAGRYESEVSLDSLYVPNHAAYTALKDACRDGTLIRVRTQEGGANKEEADAIVTELESEFPDQGESTVSITLKVTGSWAAAAA